MIEALSQADFAGLATHYGIVLLRVTGIFLFLPIFGSQLIPTRLRMGIAAVMAFVFFPIAPPLDVPPTDVGAWTVVGLRELSVGLALGMTARAIFAGVESAAGLVAGQSGFALASMVDPNSGDQSISPILFVTMLHIAVFVTADLHHVFIVGIERSYELLPPAIALPDTSGIQAAVGLMGMRLFTVAVELAAPALIVTVAMDIVMVLVGKAMPQVPILIVGYPFKMIAGLIAIGILAVGIGGAIQWIGRTIAADGAAVLHALAGS